MSLEHYSKKRFLIVDELDNFRFSTKQALMSLGLKQVDTASSAQAVSSGFQNVNYDVVLCNYELGKGKNGQELLEELRVKKLLKFTGLFFIISAEVERGKVMGTVENEPDGYLVKPVTPKDLDIRLGKALEMKEAMQPIDDALDQADYETALSFCDERLSAKAPYKLTCIKTKAWLLTKLNRLNEAESLYKDLLKNNDALWAEYGLAKIYLKSRNYKDAEVILNTIIAKDPDQVEALDLLAELYRQQGKPQEAQVLIEQAISRSPRSLLRQKALADVCIENNDDEAAMAAFRKVVKLGDQSVYAHPDQYFDFAQLLAKTSADDDDPDSHENTKEAFELLSKANKRFSSVDEIKIQTKLISASVNATIGNTEEAEAILEQVMHEDSDEGLDPETLLVAAKTMQTLGRDDEAEQTLERAADLAHRDSEQIGEIYDQLNQGISTEARQKASIQNKKGIKLYNQGETDQAAAELRLAVPLTPRHISLNLNLIQVLVKLYKTDKKPEHLAEIEKYLHRVRHIPKHHREFPRYEYLSNKYQGLGG